MAKSGIFDVIFREKPAMMLVSLLNSDEPVYGSALAKIIDCTYSHLIKVLNHMKRADLILFERQGRLKLLKLTDRGREVARCIASIRNSL